MILGCCSSLCEVVAITIYLKKMLIWKLPMLAKVQILVAAAHTAATVEAPQLLETGPLAHVCAANLLDAERQTGSAGTHTSASLHCANYCPDAFAGDAEDYLDTPRIPTVPESRGQHSRHAGEKHEDGVDDQMPSVMGRAVVRLLCVRSFQNLSIVKNDAHPLKLRQNFTPAATEEVHDDNTVAFLQHESGFPSASIRRCSRPLKNSATRCLPCAVVIRQRISNARLSTQLSTSPRYMISNTVSRRHRREPIRMARMHQGHYCNGSVAVSSHLTSISWSQKCSKPLPHAT